MCPIQNDCSAVNLALRDPDSYPMVFSGHHARKRFGQHWLRDESVLQRIIEAADLQSTDRVLEVGPVAGH